MNTIQKRWKEEHERYKNTHDLTPGDNKTKLDELDDLVDKELPKNSEKLY